MKITSFITITSILVLGFGAQAMTLPMKCSVTKYDSVTQLHTPVVIDAKYDIVIGIEKESDIQVISQVDGITFKLYSPMTIAAGLLTLAADSSTLKIATMREISAETNMLMLSFSISPTTSIFASCGQDSQPKL